MAKNDELLQRKPRCSFCGKTQDQVRRLIAGPNAYICDECITLCQEIMSEQPANGQMGQFSRRSQWQTGSIVIQSVDKSLTEIALF